MLSKSMYFIDQPLYHMTVGSPSEALTKRSEAIQYIFGAPYPASKSYTAMYPGLSGGDGAKAPAYFGRTPTYTKWLSVQMDANIWARIHFSQFEETDTLVVVNGGHGQGFLNEYNLPDFNIPGVDALTRRFAGAGCDIVLSSMPMMGENRFALNYLSIPNGVPAHDFLGTLTASVGSPLRYFLEPAIVGINYATSLRTYSRIVVYGISGGGWTTTVLAALDPRITHAYAVAGSVPLAFRNALPMEGDWEQYALPADYLDFYAMSVAEGGRRSFLMYHGHDECCFRNCAVQPWGRDLVEKLATFPGEFGITMRYAQVAHDISDKDADFIVSDALS